MVWLWHARASASDLMCHFFGKQFVVKCFGVELLLFAMIIVTFYMCYLRVLSVYVCTVLKERF